MKSPFHLMAKPSSYQCNINCIYCFYQGKDKGSLMGQEVFHQMSDEVLSCYIQKYINANPSTEIEFAWQGGEPTMAGLDFFKKALSYQRRFSQGKTITNTIQTNGILIDDNWASFLADNKILVGISLDGPKHIHDKYRATNGGKSVHGKVINAVNLLKKYRVDFNILSVVNDYSANYPLEVYQYLTQEIGVNYVQFIPAVERRLTGEINGELLTSTIQQNANVTSWSVSAKQYAHFINSIFDYWIAHDIGDVFVQLFENTLAAWIGQKPSMCVMRATCGTGLVIEQNGDIYSCDHFVYPENKLGNIMDDRLDRLVYGKKQKSFGMQKANFSTRCLACEYRFACQGGCPKHRIDIVNGKQHNYLCDGYKLIFQHLEPYMKQMAWLLAQGRPAYEIKYQVNNIIK